MTWATKAAIDIPSRNAISSALGFLRDAVETNLGVRRLPATRVPLTDEPEDIEAEEEEDAAEGSLNTLFFAFFLFLPMGFSGLASPGKEFGTAGFEGLGLASTVVVVVVFSWSAASG